MTELEERRAAAEGQIKELEGVLAATETAVEALEGEVVEVKEKQQELEASSGEQVRLATGVGRVHLDESSEVRSP